MKKLLLLCLVLLGGVMQMSATEVTVYLMVNSNYTASSAKIAFIAQQSGTDNQTWGIFGDYKTNVLKASFEYNSNFNEFYLFRMPSTYDGSTKPWDTSRWNTSANHAVPSTTTYFSVPASVSDGFTCKSTTDVPDFDGYYMTSNINGWARNTKMTEVSTGVYSVSFSGVDYAEKLVTWAPGYAFNAENYVEQWDLVLRPNTEDYKNHWINFANYSYNTLYTATGANKSVWYLPHTGTDDQKTNEGQVTISYTPSTNSANITCTKTATIGAAGYITYSNGEKCTISGATAYRASVNNTSTVKLAEMDAATVWPENEGMILKGNNGTKVTINAVGSSTDASSIGTNFLVGTGNAAKQVTVSNPNNAIYIFAKDDTEGVGFFKASASGELAAHKAYLDLGKNGGLGSRDFLGLSFDDETTGIANPNVNDNVNFNADAPMYNLAGQRVSKSYKGVVIVNGKKMLNK